jgi:hypothetical protein
MIEMCHARLLCAATAGERWSATCGCLGRDRRFQPLFSIVINNEKSRFSVVQRVIADLLPRQ